jgi:predicted nucleic acid-binding protein
MVDSTVWIAYLRGEDTPHVGALETAIDEHRILVADLALHEVLRGMPNEAAALRARQEFDNFSIVHVGGEDIAIESARIYRALRSRGTTIRGAVDLLIGTWCIANAVSLLHNDRDFAPLELHFGLKRWPALH